MRRELFDRRHVAESDRYLCVLCGKEIRRRPTGARIAHAQMHVRKGEAHCVVGLAPFYHDEYYAGPASEGGTRVRS